MQQTSHTPGPNTIQISGQPLLACHQHGFLSIEVKVVQFPAPISNKITLSPTAKGVKKRKTNHPPLRHSDPSLRTRQIESTFPSFLPSFHPSILSLPSLSFSPSSLAYNAKRVACAGTPLSLSLIKIPNRTKQIYTSRNLYMSPTVSSI